MQLNQTTNNSSGTFPCGGPAIPLPISYGGTGTSFFTIQKLSVYNGGTGLSIIPLNSILLGNGTSVPTFQTLSGDVMDTQSVQLISNKIFNGNCNIVTNINVQRSVTGILSTINGGTGISNFSSLVGVLNGGTGLTSIMANSILIGNGTNKLTTMTFSNAILDTNSVQSISNKIINMSCNTITNINYQSSVTGILPIINGGTGTSNGATVVPATTLAALTDVNLTTLVNGQFLEYISSNNKWNNITPPVVAFYATMSSPLSIVAGASGTLPYPVATYNMNNQGGGGAYSTSTYMFTAPIAGIYKFTLILNASSTASARWLTSWIINSSPLTNYDTTTSPSLATNAYTESLTTRLLVNDTVSVGYQNGTVTMTLGSTYNVFQGSLVAAL
jgi:hypothetical protein